MYNLKTILILIKNLYKIIQINDEPVATIMVYTFFGYKKIRKEGYDLIYGGLGGDEFNAGEYEYFLSFLLIVTKITKITR